MRTVYHEQLSDLDLQLGEMCALAGAVMKQATSRPRWKLTSIQPIMWSASIRGWR